MKSMYEQFKEGTLQAGQRVTFTGTVEEIDNSDDLFPVLVNIEGNGKMWLREGTIKYMEPAPDKLHEVSIGDHLEAVAIAQEVTKNDYTTFELVEESCPKMLSTIAQVKAKIKAAQEVANKAYEEIGRLEADLEVLEKYV